ncbi:hypothetical protein C8R47DRAFT_141520 [Mycena vitilis]|nr:hypothetical protein C8R47DRAFT_141520 [Mycena vitilis]
MSPTIPTRRWWRVSFEDFGKEIHHRILAFCTLRDLCCLQYTSKRIYHLIYRHPSYWRDARERLGLPSPPQLSAHGIWGEAAYASFLFGGGQCLNCNQHCEGLPAHFALRFRLCSVECEQLTP